MVIAFRHRRETLPADWSGVDWREAWEVWWPLASPRLDLAVAQLVECIV